MGETVKPKDRLLIQVCSVCEEQVRPSGMHAHGGGLAPLREIEVVPLTAHEIEVEDATARVFEIYGRSKAEALASSVPEYIELGGHGGYEWGISMDNRGRAKAFFAAEIGVDFTDVRARRRYMRIDFALIADLSAQMAAVPEDYGEKPIAYTWEDEGWAWTDCEPDAAGAVAFWHCSEKSAQQKEGR